MFDEEVCDMKHKYETPEMEVFKFTLDICANVRVSQNDTGEGGFEEDIEKPTDNPFGW